MSRKSQPYFPAVADTNEPPVSPSHLISILERLLKILKEEKDALRLEYEKNGRDSIRFEREQMVATCIEELFKVPLYENPQLLRVMGLPPPDSQAYVKHIRNMEHSKEYVALLHDRDEVRRRLESVIDTEEACTTLINSLRRRT